ncbi:hypothetical protein LNTAR_05689 [Lentisphaera araneosa HTCC2155]|uniref:Uncharacterized protein n=1 Tax=Lentisphaera araneosa HTCC2155 TaxID=313628 RepID=A6DPE6_9BACT|nr:hypothetical protein LNTAR_05689 [Lentisphaera araneosa HTCC2155]
MNSAKKLELRLAMKAQTGTIIKKLNLSSNIFYSAV